MRAADLGEHPSLLDRPDVPRRLAEVVERAMARRPEDRFASADDLARALNGSVPHEDARLPGPASKGAGGDGDGDAGAARGTSTYGPRPPRKEPEPMATRLKVPIVLVVGLGAALAVFLIRGPLRSDPECPDVEPPVADPGGRVVEGDPEGDGCSTFGLYQLQTLADGSQVMVLTIRVDGDQQRIAIGQPGDQVVLGDWDCDGVDTPALYQAAAGQVQYFNVWPEVEQQQYQPDRTEPAAQGGTASLERGRGEGDDCDRVVVA
jgi:hypothetical protein